MVQIFSGAIFFFFFLEFYILINIVLRCATIGFSKNLSSTEYFYKHSLDFYVVAILTILMNLNATILIFNNSIFWPNTFLELSGILFSANSVPDFSFLVIHFLENYTCPLGNINYYVKPSAVTITTRVIIIFIYNIL